ncbi:MAG: TonB-dependent receptor [Bacteroidales bacterium]|jgi:outer membrane receptor for ferrienterochelin and colicins|nr:TonB-dependent receptor [Bacteroidales bacterium]
MKKIYIVISLVINSLLLFSQKTDSNIIGHVLDKETKEHLLYVSIGIKGSTIGTTTDGSGHYLLNNVPEGRQIVFTSYMGYKTEEVEIEIKKGRTIEINFEIEKSAIALDEIVVSANRIETSRREAPTLVNVMTPKVFENTNSCNIGQALNYQPGLRVETNCQNCGFQQVRINGLEGHYSQVLIDSRPVIGSLAGVYGLEQIPTNMIERIEVIRGGGSAIFGASAIGGIVNIITKEPTRNTFTVSNNTSLIGGKSIDNNTTLNASMISQNRRAGGYIFGTVRNRQEYDANNDGYSEIGRLKGTNIGMNSYYLINNKSKITLEYHFTNEYRRGGDSIDLQPHEVNVAEMTEYNIHSGNIKYDFISRNEKQRFSLYSSIQNVDRDSYYGAGKDLNAYGKTSELIWVSGGQYSISFNKFLFMPAQLMAGAEYTYNTLNDEMLGYNRIINQKVQIVSAFLQNEWKNKQISILIGTRIDKHNLINNVIFSPRANVRYSPLESMSLRVSYASGFRAPQAFDEDLHITAVGGGVTLIQLAPDLRPEYSHSISGSADFSKTFNKTKIELLLEGFYTTINDVFILQESGTDEHGNIILERINGSGAYVGGLNAEFKATFPYNIGMQLGYTYQQSRYKNPETWSENPELQPQKRMFRTPDHYGFITLDYALKNRFVVAVSGIYTGNMLVQHFAGYVEKDTEVITPHFFDMNVKLSYDFTLSGNIILQLNAGVQNVFNSYQSDFDYGMDRDAGYVYGPSLPRTYFVGVKFMM